MTEQENPIIELLNEQGQEIKTELARLTDRADKQHLTTPLTTYTRRVVQITTGIDINQKSYEAMLARPNVIGWRAGQNRDTMEVGILFRFECPDRGEAAQWLEIRTEYNAHQFSAIIHTSHEQYKMAMSIGNALAQFDAATEERMLQFLALILHHDARLPEGCDSAIYLDEGAFCEQHTAQALGLRR